MPVFAPPSPITYDLDGSDRILKVGGMWMQFADENGGRGVEPHAVRGRCIHDFIADEETRLVYRRVFAAVRNQGRIIDLAFRCDSPTSRRSFAMHLEPLARKGVRISTRVLLIEARPAQVDVVESPFSQVRRCSICNKIWWSGCWREVENAVAEGLTVQAGSSLPVAHCTCTACSMRVRTAVERSAPRARTGDPNRSPHAPRPPSRP